MEQFGSLNWPLYPQGPGLTDQVGEHRPLLATARATKLRRWDRLTLYRPGRTVLSDTERCANGGP